MNNIDRFFVAFYSSVIIIQLFFVMSRLNTAINLLKEIQ